MTYIETMSTAHAFVLALLADGPPPSEPPDWARVSRLLRQHRLEGLAVARHRREGGGLLPVGLAGGLEAAYRRTSLWTTLLVEAGERARDALDAEAIPSLVFKGAALVRSGAYPDPGARAMDDADLLVPEAAADGAVQALIGAGFRPWEPWEASRAGWVDSASFIDPSSPAELPVALDLHWRTGYGRMRFGGGGDGGRQRRRGRSDGRPDDVHGARESSGDRHPSDRSPSILWEGADLDRGLPAPAPHLVLLAEHFLKHLRYRVHLAALGDLARTARRIGAGLEHESRGHGGGAGSVADGTGEPPAGAGWSDVVRLAEESPLASGIGHLLAECRREMEIEVPCGVVERLAAEGRFGRGAARRVRPSELVGVESPVSSRLEGLLLRWRLLGTAARILHDVGHAALPSRRWLRARYGGPGDGGRATPLLWLRYVRDVLRWTTGRARSPASPNQDLLDRLEAPGGESGDSHPQHRPMR